MAKKKQPVESKSLLEKFDTFIEKYDTVFFWIIFAIAALVSMGIYDPRVSLTGDDCTYILNAKAFISDFKFPGYQGPLYPMVLSLLVLIFGISLLPLKLFSMVAMLGFFYITFISFRKRIPATVLFTTLLLLALNAPTLYYASQTYSEAFYMFMQSVMILLFIRFFLDKSAELKPTKKWIVQHAWLALSLLALATSRSIGFAGIIAIVAYFLLKKEWKNLVTSLAFFILIFALYTVARSLIWGNGELQFASQGSGLMNKDFYHPELGKEDAMGMLVRFAQNAVQYLSFGLFNIIGFTVLDISLFRTLLVFAIAITVLVVSSKKSKYLFFSTLLGGTSLFVTFFALQVSWNQDRLVIPFYPYILFCVFYLLYYLLSLKNARYFQFVYFVVFIFFLGASLKSTSTAIEASAKIHNKYSGLSPDWVHYIKVSEWTENNLKSDEIVACRKPTISSVYANGKMFHGIFTVPSGNSASFIRNWSKAPNDYFAVPITNTFQELPPAIKPYYYAFIQFETSNFWILKNSVELKNSFVANKIPTVGLEEIKSLSQQSSGKFSIMYPDSLLNILRSAKVTHILSASLRINPEFKTGETLSTVERYAYFIQEKYPNIFEFVYADGTPDDEPARIFKINWNVVKQ